MTEKLPQSRHLATEIPGPLSTAAMQRRKEAVSGGLGTAIPVIIKRASDAILEDIDGFRIGNAFEIVVDDERQLIEQRHVAALVLRLLFFLFEQTTQ